MLFEPPGLLESLCELLATQPEQMPALAQSLFPVGQAVTREQIERLEAFMVDLPDEVKLTIPVEQRFADGLYVRRVVFPAGAILTGEVHRYSHYSQLLSGEMLTLHDGRIQHVKGPIDMIAQAGIKRVGIALTEVVWITVHGNPPDTQDQSALEEWLVLPNPRSGRGMKEIS